MDKPQQKHTQSVNDQAIKKLTKIPHNQKNWQKYRQWWSTEMPAIFYDTFHTRLSWNVPNGFSFERFDPVHTIQIPCISNHFLLCENEM